jgi:hypothetical protein
MPSTVITLVGLIVAAALIVVLVRFMGRDKIEAIIKKRKAGSLLVCAAEFVEGPTRLDVALAIDQNKLYYENVDVQAYLVLKQLEEVEYDDSLLTGGHHVEGKVLRLRSHGHTFEFVMDEADIKKCMKVLPPHRADEPGEVHAESVASGA